MGGDAHTDMGIADMDIIADIYTRQDFLETENQSDSKEEITNFTLSNKHSSVIHQRGAYITLYYLLCKYNVQE